eukprot:scaffold61712_cov69-Phaeocystis_antarctica.AAC.17
MLLSESQTSDFTPHPARDSLPRLAIKAGKVRWAVARVNRPVVEAARARVWGKVRLPLDCGHHAAKHFRQAQYAPGGRLVPYGKEVSVGAPRVPDISTPLVRLTQAPRANREHHRTTGGVHRRRHAFVIVPRGQRDVVHAAVVVLDVVDTCGAAHILSGLATVLQQGLQAALGTPFRIVGGVLSLVPAEAEGVHVVSECLHARRKLLGVRLDVSVGCSVSLPAIVHVEVAVASIPQAGAHQTTGHLP